MIEEEVNIFVQTQIITAYSELKIISHVRFTIRNSFNTEK